MQTELPDVAVMLMHRTGAPEPRENQAWQEALEAYPGGGSIIHVWAGAGPVPAGADFGSPADAASVLGLDGDAVAVVTEASAVPGPHLLARMVESVLAAKDRVVDARCLPVELTRVSGRERGYYLKDGADPQAAMLREDRHANTDDDEDEDEDVEDVDDGEREDDDVEDRDEVAPAPTSSSLDGSDADPTREEPGVSGHDLRAQDGWILRARASGVCCAVRSRHLRALDQSLLAPPSEASGPQLVAVADAEDLDVVVEETAAVSMPVRLGWDAHVTGWVTPRHVKAVEWSDHAHPAELPDSLLGGFARQLGLRPVSEPVPDDVSDRPFLSIVTRTQGRRLHCLEDLLTCLAGQEDRDFEWLVTCHRTTAEELADVREVVASAPGWLRDRVRLVEVERPGRASPLNDGFAAATGRYVVALDDDDTVLAHYVATFKEAAADDGRVLRAVAVRQDVAPVGGIETMCAVSVEDPFREWPMDFNLVDHLVSNYSPIMTVAFPRAAFHALDLRFDETLDTTEDWDLVVRSAAVLGVTSIREVTSVYRWWVHTGASSRELHSKEEWAAARQRIQKTFANTVLLLAPEETRRMLASLQRARRDSDKSHRTARRLATSQHEVILRMDEVKAAHDRAVDTANELRGRTKAAQDKVLQVRTRMRKRHSQQLRLLREADLLLAERPHLRPSGSIVDLPVDELRDLVQRLRAEPARRRWASRLTR